MTFSTRIFSRLKSSIFPSEPLGAFESDGATHACVFREGTKTTPAHRFNDFTIRSYAPVAFRHFRELFNIKPDEFLVGFTAVVVDVHLRAFLLRLCLLVFDM